MLSAGAFSDDAVIAASKGVVCVYVDCDWGRNHADLIEKYGVQFFPTVVYCDSNGEEVGRMQTFDAGVIAGEIARLARDHAKPLR